MEGCHNDNGGHAKAGCTAHLPVVRPDVSSSKVNGLGGMIGNEVLPCQTGPACARVDWLPRTALGVKALLPHCDHMVWIGLLQVLGHLINP